MKRRLGIGLAGLWLTACTTPLPIAPISSREAIIDFSLEARFALRATALGLRHAHINQPIEVPAVRREFAQWVGVGRARPDLVVRFGYAPAMPMSLRRRVSVETA